MREQLILFSRSKICLYNKKKKIDKVKPKEYQVEAVHKVATEWYSGGRLVWVKLDGSQNTTPWQPCEPPQPDIP